MASKVEAICAEKVQPEIEKLGYVVLEIDYSKKVDGQNLTFVIDKDGGINIEDCEKVHRLVDDLLEQINPTDDNPYILNVESAGLDRPIKCERDFIRNKDKTVEVKLYTKLDDKKTFVGLLKEYNNDYVVLEIDGLSKQFNLNQVAIITPVITF